MNKKDLARAIAGKTGFSVVDTLTTLNTFFEVVKETMVKKEKVQLVGFGTFEVRKRIERIGKSPQDPTKEIVIPEKNVPYFKPGSDMKAGVNAKPGKASKKEGKAPAKKAAAKKTAKTAVAVQGVVAKTEKTAKPAPKKGTKTAAKAAPAKKIKK